MIVKSSESVDIFLVKSPDAESISSTEDAKKFGAKIYEKREDFDEVITAPLSWLIRRQWQLVIGNLSGKDSAVYYEVTEVKFEREKGSLFRALTQRD